LRLLADAVPVLHVRAGKCLLLFAAQHFYPGTTADLPEGGQHQQIASIQSLFDHCLSAILPGDFNLPAFQHTVFEKIDVTALVDRCIWNYQRIDYGSTLYLSRNVLTYF